MNRPGRKSLVAAAIILVIALSRLVTTNALSTIRAVDAVLLFAAGMAAGVLLVQLLRMRKA